MTKVQGTKELRYTWTCTTCGNTKNSFESLKCKQCGASPPKMHEAKNCMLTQTTDKNPSTV